MGEASRPHAMRITEWYGRSNCLAAVRLKVRAGEVAAVVGANGCGKRTRLRICAGWSARSR